MKILVLAALLFSVTAISLGCGSEQVPTHETKKDSHHDDSQVVLKEQEIASSEINPSDKFIKVSDKATAQRDAAECSRWVYQKTNLVSDLEKMRPAGQEEWGRRCYQFSCAYEGNAFIAGKKQKVTINAGGWISLANEKGKDIQYFLSSKTLPGFLAACDCCE